MTPGQQRRRLLLRPLAADEGQARFWLLHVRLGVVLSEVIALLVFGYTVTAHRPHPIVVTALAVTVVVASPLLLLLPVQKMTRSPHGALLFYVWSAATTVLICAAVLLDGGPRSPLMWLIVLTLTYSGLAYPPIGVLAMGGVMVGAYGTLAAVSSTPPSQAVTTAGVLVVFTVMSAWTSRNQWTTYERQTALAAELAGLAERDSLTDCLNRRAFGQKLTEALRGAAPDCPVSVCLIDLDGFKQVNDGHGHAAGDRVLLRVAGALRVAVRIDDSVSRLGGDEFAVLMPGLGHELASTIAERLVAGLRTVGLEHGVTASVGTCTAVAPTDVDDFLHAADQAMYAAKAAGGNRTSAVRPAA